MHSHNGILLRPEPLRKGALVLERSVVVVNGLKTTKIHRFLFCENVPNKTPHVFFKQVVSLDELLAGRRPRGGGGAGGAVEPRQAGGGPDRALHVHPQAGEGRVEAGRLQAEDGGGGRGRHGVASLD